MEYLGNPSLLVENLKNIFLLTLYFFLTEANGTETVAIPEDDGSYNLFGYKWFSSATDADISLTLARVQHPDGSTVPVSIFNNDNDN